jgi:uncharacterized protein (TIGR03435 family)
MRLTLLFCFTTLVGSAQTFDVASIKPAEPMTGGRIMIGVRGGPGTEDPGRITYTGMPVKMVIANAFDVKGYQIQGPSWLDTERFDITVKVPAGATKEQARIMMQNLLAERFRLAIHHETKEMASYVLTVGSKGLKMKSVDPEPAPDPNSAPPLPPPGGRGPMKMGKDGFPEMPAFAGRGGGPMMIMMNGKAKMMCTSCPVSRITETLGNQLGKPVVDQTGLTGNFEFSLFFEPDMSNMRMVGVPPPPGAAGFSAPGGGAGAGPAPEGNLDTAPPLLSAIQDQLGLKLEPKKAPADLIVIDHMEKTPTEN